jgi:hypothetical protein
MDHRSAMTLAAALLASTLAAHGAIAALTEKGSPKADDPKVTMATEFLQLTSTCGCTGGDSSSTGDGAGGYGSDTGGNQGGGLGGP